MREPASTLLLLCDREELFDRRSHRPLRNGDDGRTEVAQECLSHVRLGGTVTENASGAAQQRESQGRVRAARLRGWLHAHVRYDDRLRSASRAELLRARDGGKVIDRRANFDVEVPLL